MKPRKLERGEVPFVLLFAIGSIFLFFLSLKLFLENTSLSSPGSFPLFASILMLITSGLMLFEIRKCERSFEPKTKLKQKMIETLGFLFPGEIGIVIVYVILYAILLSHLGFTICTLLFLWLTMVTLNKTRTVRSLAKSFVISCGSVIGVLLIFQFIFRVVLP